MEAHRDKERRGRAQNILGRMYQSGEGVPRNRSKAAVCFREAAELGDMNGQYNLARMYQQGNEVSCNHREAAKWFRMAAVQGHAQAQYCFGVLCAKGLGVPQDLKKAEKWKIAAAEQGEPRAQNHCGVSSTTPVLISAAVWTNKPNNIITVSLPNPAYAVSIGIRRSRINATNIPKPVTSGDTHSNEKNNRATARITSSSKISIVMFYFRVW